MSVVICTHDGTEHEWQPGGKCPDAIPAGTWSVRSTADVPVSGGIEVRQQLAKALYWHMTEADESRGCALRCGYDGPDRSEHLADALLPAVERIAAERAAEALRDAADELRQNRDDATNGTDEGDPWTYNEAALTCSQRAEATAAGRQETT